MDGDFDWEDYDDAMQDYLPTMEDLAAMGIDPEDLQNLPDDQLYEILQQYMMAAGQYGDMYEDYPGMGAESPSMDLDFSFYQHFQDCTSQVVWQGLQMMIPLLLLCGSLRISALLDIPKGILHIVCTCSGLFLMWHTFQHHAAYILALSALAYLLLLVLDKLPAFKQKGPICAIMCISTLVSWEVFLADPTDWHKIRGAQMILAMKVISLGFDLDQGSVAALPSVQEYCGYTFCVGTCIFGPWVSFNSYLDMLKPNPLSIRWLYHVISSWLLGIVCLVLSACVTPVLAVGNDAKWVVAYKDAASFRWSHYFVSYISATSSLLAGYGARTDTDGNQYWEFSVAKPLHIEVPRSLVEVVTNWNLPMHYWLKNYVFKTSRALGNLAAVLMTYVASALLHGLNFQLSAVLLSLGVYSYVEYVFRNRLADIFSACIKARKCRGECIHQYKSTNPCVVLINLLFGCLSVFHLAYLGVMFNNDPDIQEEGYTMAHTLDKWSSLDFASHYVVAGTFLFYFLIK